MNTKELMIYYLDLVHKENRTPEEELTMRNIQYFIFWR